jgi:hypothetical protein
MSIAIIDAREWQNLFDLKTGAKVADDGPCVRMARGVLARHPFPGDMDERGNEWVTDVALDFIREYDPGFVWVTYAQQFYNHRYTPMSEDDRLKMVKAACMEAERFLELSGFAALIVATGDMAPFAGFVDVTKLDGLALSTHWSTRYAGLHEPSSRDLKRLSDIPEIERIVTREDLLRLFPESPCDPSRESDYVMVAKPGYAFKTSGGVHRRLNRIPLSCFKIPISTNLGTAADITDVRKILDKSLAERKTALILLEGIGFSEFPWPHTEAANGRDWYFYEPGDAQHLAISTGQHRLFDYPIGYKYFDEVTDNKEYPLSGYFTSVPDGTVGRDFGGRSIAVGNRSMYTHMVPGADISLECFARNLYNQGTMVVIHRQDKM